MGYYGVFIGLDYQHNRQMSKEFDTDIYNTNEAITIKIPVTIPYANESADFQRVDGKFEHMGNTYRLVKQRILNDTLYLVCVTDVKAQQIAQALKDYVKTFSDKPAETKSQSKTQVRLVKDYIQPSYSIIHLFEGMFIACNQTSHPVFIDSFYASIVHPPERG